MVIDVYLADWLSLILRWAHIITGIAWIGSSFYFIWLDARLNVPPRDPENRDVAGDLWAVHGGGFYHAQKYKVAPAQLPEPLHWFKWEAYFTWMTGVALFIVGYYLNAESMLTQSKAVVEQASAGVQQCRRRLEILGVEPGQFGQRVSVRAPISGKVLEMNVVPGEFRNDLSAPLLTIADLSSVWVTSDVPETSIRQIQVGEPITIERGGMMVPGVTSEPAATREPSPITASSRTIEPMPINEWS